MLLLHHLMLISARMLRRKQLIPLPQTHSRQQSYENSLAVDAACSGNPGPDGYPWRSRRKPTRDFSFRPDEGD